MGYCLCVCALNRVGLGVRRRLSENPLRRGRRSKGLRWWWNPVTTLLGLLDLLKLLDLLSVGLGEQTVRFQESGLVVRVDGWMAIPLVLRLRLGELRVALRGLAHV